MKLMCLSTVDDDGGSGGGAVSFQLAAALTDTSIALSTSFFKGDLCFFIQHTGHWKWPLCRCLPWLSVFSSKGTTN